MEKTTDDGKRVIMMEFDYLVEESLGQEGPCCVQKMPNYNIWWCGLDDDDCYITMVHEGVFIHDGATGEWREWHELVNAAT